MPEGGGSWRLWARLLAALLPPVVLGVAAIVWVQYAMARREIRRVIGAEIDALARRTADAIDEDLRQRQADVLNLSESPLLADYYHNLEYGLAAEASAYRAELERLFLNFSRRSGLYARVLLVDPRGADICLIERDRPGSRRGAPDRAVIAAQALRLRGEALWVSPIEDGASGAPVLYFVRAVRDEQGKLQAALALGYDLGSLAAVLDRVPLGRRAWAYVRTPQGRFPSRSEEGGELLQARSSIKVLPWTVVVEAPLSESFAPVEKVRTAAVGASLLGLLALVAVILLLVRSLTRPIASLAAAARRIGGGDLSVRVEDLGGGEIGELGRTFNEMAASLEENRRRNSELQLQLVQTAKLSAVGQLISAVNHELRAPLTAIFGHVQLMRKTAPAPMHDALDRVFRAAERCRRVVENLLLFARPRRRSSEPVDVNEAVRAATDMLRYRFRTLDARYEEELDPELPRVLGDPQELVQVLVNLIGNACDALEEIPPRDEGRRVQVRTRREGDGVLLRVEDNGPGISPEAVEKVFQPFYSTKEAGRGTGLGLSISRQIVEAHRGSLGFESVPGGGVAFLARFPADDGSELVEPEEESLPLAPVPGKRILVVDNEKDITDFIAKALSEERDEVVALTDPADALRRIQEEDFDLVVSDMQMERVRGPDLYRAAAAKGKRRPPVLFITGDIINAEVLNFLTQHKLPYLVKPIRIPDLQQAVRRLLSGLGAMPGF